MDRKKPLSERFRRFASRTSATLGSVEVFTAAFAFVLLWSVTGPLFDFSDTWQLTMNTVASVVAFLMVFVIQNTQNRDARAVHLKLDELIRVLRGARRQLLTLEDFTDDELDRLQREFEELKELATSGDGDGDLTGHDADRADPADAAVRPDARDAGDGRHGRRADEGGRP